MPSNDELCRLCREGKLFAVEEWFHGGGQPEVSPRHRRDWAMGIAIEKGFHSLVEVLLKNGFPADGKTLWEAVRQRRHAIVELLLDSGAELSLAPSALMPWRFYGTMRHQQSISLFRVNGITGACSTVGEVPVMDDAFVATLKQVPEFRLMREVSPEYHVVEALSENGGVQLLCRDMRVRNFGTRFGDLEVWLDSNRQVARSRFYV